MAEQQQSEWIGYRGPECPVSDSTVVEVFLLSEIGEGWETCPKRADEWDWSVEDVPGDIIAYRLASAQAAK